MQDMLGAFGDYFSSLPHLAGWVTLAWLAYLVPLCAWIVLQKREPVATLSWLLGLALLPYLGFLIYHVFGPQKIRRNRLRRSHSRASMRSAQIESEQGEGAELVRLGQATTGLPATSSAQVDLLIDGGGCGLEPTTVVDLSGPVPVVLRQGKGRSAAFD